MTAAQAVTTANGGSVNSSLNDGYDGALSWGLAQANGTPATGGTGRPLTYTDLDGKTSGHVTYSGSNVTFVGGHLAGQVGRNIRNGTNFEINSVSCSRN